MSTRPRAALVFICSKEEATTHINNFNRLYTEKQETISLVALPLFTDVAHFIVNSLSIITTAPCYQKHIEKSILSVDSYGIGFNVSTKEFLIKNWEVILQNANLETDCILSSLENPTLRFGYPNFDIVGCLGFGKIEKNESPYAAAIRETHEESYVAYDELK
jgi:hypothetical protein